MRRMAGVITRLQETEAFCSSPRRRIFGKSHGGNMGEILASRSLG
jgi:hypothetical protein